MKLPRILLAPLLNCTRSFTERKFQDNFGQGTHECLLHSPPISLHSKIKFNDWVQEGHPLLEIEVLVTELQLLGFPFIEREWVKFPVWCNTWQRINLQEV